MCYDDECKYEFGVELTWIFHLDLPAACSSPYDAQRIHAESLLSVSRTIYYEEYVGNRTSMNRVRRRVCTKIVSYRCC